MAGRVLVVDDKAENLYLLSALLGAHGYDVDTARHGGEALALAEASQPDLVISDLLMPVMDGYRLLRHWKSDPTLRSACFIVYTATYTGPDDERLAINLGADAFLLKPREPEELMDWVRRLIDAEPRLPAIVGASELDEEGGIQSEYNAILVRKLEARTIELEAANQALRDEIAARQRMTSMRDAILDALPARIALIDADGIILAVNDSWRHFAARAGVPGRFSVEGENYLEMCDLMEVSRPGLPQGFSARIRDVLEGRMLDYAVEYPFTFDAEVVWLRMIVTPISGSQGSGAVVTHLDISEQRLQEGQLRQAERLRSVGQLTGGVAHDFNNLLTVILGNGEILESALAEDEALQSLAQMTVRAAERGAELSAQLLAFSRRQRLDPTTVDIATLVSDVETLLRRAAGGAVDLAIDHGKRLWPALVDAAQLENALVNLCVNARDAMPDGGRVTISTRNATIRGGGASGVPAIVAGDYVTITVTDTGIGMDDRTRQQAFDPFFTTKEVGRGSGLGLSTVYGFIQQSHGHIDIESAPGAGTTIRLHLPRSVQPVEAAEPTGLRMVPRGDEHILIVEDDELVRHQAVAQLQALGYSVATAGNAQDALAMLRDDAGFDLLFTDVVMPGGMNGRQLADEVACTHPAIAILFTSGYSEGAVAAARKGGNRPALLPKPYRRADLAIAVRGALDGR